MNISRVPFKFQSTFFVADAQHGPLRPLPGGGLRQGRRPVLRGPDPGGQLELRQGEGVRLRARGFGEN